MRKKETYIDPRVGNFIKARRKKLGISQRVLAKRFKLSQPVFISLIENGKSKLPNTWALKMAKELKVKPEKIIRLIIKAETDQIQREIISENFL